VPSLTVRPPVTEPRFSSQQAFWCLMLGLGTSLNVKLIGYLPLSELAILAMTPFILPRLTSRAVWTYARWPTLLGLLWLGAQTLTDVFLQTRFDLAARGFARVVTLVACLPFFVWFLQHQTYRRLLWITLGMVPSMILSAYILRPGTIEGRQMVTGVSSITWETHWAGVVSTASRFAILLTYASFPLFAYALESGLGVMNVSLGSRSAGAMPIIGTASAAAYATVTGRRALIRKLGIARLTMLCLLVLGAFGGVYVGYKMSAQSGLLGEKAQQKYEKQSQNRLGLLAGGRSEAIAGLLAVADSPFIGYGSWPLDTPGFYLKACEFLEEEPNMLYYKQGFPVIPAHSHIICNWVESGILSIWYWVYVLVLSGRMLISPIKDEKHLRLWVSVSATYLIWNVLFSPIGGRLNTALTVAVFLLQTKNGVLRRRAPHPVMDPIALAANAYPIESLSQRAAS